MVKLGVGQTGIASSLCCDSNSGRCHDESRTVSYASGIGSEGACSRIDGACRGSYGASIVIDSAIG
jgi:hypothetical protein